METLKDIQTVFLSWCHQMSESLQTTRLIIWAAFILNVMLVTNLLKSVFHICVSFQCSRWKLPSLSLNVLSSPVCLLVTKEPVAPGNSFSERTTNVDHLQTEQLWVNWWVCVCVIRRHTLSRRRIIPLPQWKANPETDPEALFSKDQLVLALYPQTTCFYRALIHTPPHRVRPSAITKFSCDARREQRLRCYVTNLSGSTPAVCRSPDGG